VNFLISPMAPLGVREAPDVGRCLRALALFRLTNPRADVRAAGGRERVLGSFQGLALFAATSIFVDGYLTTPGQVPAEARRMIEDLGFEVDLEAPAAVIPAFAATS
jgi:biotin synthase